MDFLLGMTQLIGDQAIQKAELVKLNLEIEKSEVQYRKLFENMKAGFVLFETVLNEQGIPVDLVVLAANTGFEKTTGLNLRDATGTFLSRALPGIEKDEADWIGTYSKVALTGEAVQFEQSSELLDRYYSISAFQAGPNRCAVTFVDITERKLAEIRLADSEERLRLSTELAKVAVWEYDFTTDSMSRSGNHDKLYGLEWQEKWNINTFLEATHPEDREISNHFIQNSVRPGGPDDYSFDFRVVFPDNSIHWLSVKGRVIERDEKGQGLRVRGTLIDITSLKQTEITLRESEERYRNILESAPVGISIHQKGRIVFINPAGLKIMGAESYEQILGRETVSIIHPGNAEDSKMRLQRLLSGEEGLYPVEDKYIRIDGTVIDVEVMATLLSYKNEPAEQCIFTDITERKKMLKDLVSALKDKEQLVQELSHRSYNNMQVIQALLQYKQYTHPDLSLSQFVIDINDQIRSMAFAHRELLRGEHLSKIDLEEYLKNLVQYIIDHNQQDEEIKLTFDIFPTQILLDTAGPLGIIVNELVSNSVRHAFPNRRREIPAEIRISSRAKESGEIELFISDNGSGWSPDDDQSTSAAGGTGLVFALVTEQLGGTISFDGTNGTTCVISFNDNRYTERV